MRPKNTGSTLVTMAICLLAAGVRFWACRDCRYPVRITRATRMKYGSGAPEPVVRVDGRLLEVDPQELEVVDVVARVHVISVAARAERLVERRVGGDVLVGVAQHPEQREEDRQLEQQGQAARQRVDLVLLVELHGLFVELLAVALVLRLDLLDLGRSFCMAIIDFACFAVSGNRISMIVNVSRMIATPEVRDDRVEQGEQPADGLNTADQAS